MVHNDSHELPKGRRSSTGKFLEYRLYYLDGVDSLISYSHEFEAEDDDHAIGISEAWREGRAAELWCGSRKVSSWDRMRES